MAFLLVKRAYQDRNVHAARAYLTHELWDGWRPQVQQLIDQHRRPVLENLNVRGMQVPFVAHGEGGDTIQVHLDYVAAVHTVDEGTGKVVDGTTDDQRLGELWTFTRLAGAKTVASGGATASRCPNCGGLLKLNDDGVCDYCKADIASGRHADARRELQRVINETAPTFVADCTVKDIPRAKELLASIKDKS